MVSGKARAANDMTVGQAESAHAMAVRMHLHSGGNPIGIWALLIGLPRREQSRLMQAWGIYSLKELAEAIAALEVSHAPA